MVLPYSIHFVSAQGRRNHKRYHKLPLCGFVMFEKSGSFDGSKGLT